MNKIYKIIWSKVKNCYVVVSELAKNHTKSPKNGVVNQKLENHVMLSLYNSAVCVPVFSTGFVAPIATNIATKAKKEWNKPFKITVAAIVKNEAENVPTWVEAARSCADEIVVVDTGSTDGTVERFADYGIKCFHYKWNDDFAAAKNYMISLCHGDWIVLLDGDEWFREGCDVRKAIAKHHNNPVTKAIIADWICLDTSRDNAIMFSGGAVRAFRNQPDIRYFRKVHENLTIKYENFVFEPDFKMYHTGYSGNVNRSKHERNLRIMRTMFDFDNGKVEFPTDWRYIQDTYAGLGDFEKSLWASDQMLSFGIPEYSATSWLTRFNVLFAMRASMERMDKEFEYCFKTVPSVSGFRFLASIYYFRNGRIDKALDNYIEGLRLLMGPQDKVAQEHTYWRMYLPEASALASAVYLQNKQVEAALYSCKVSEQYCGKNNWTDLALADVRRLMYTEDISVSITDRLLPIFHFSKKAVLATTLVSTITVGMVTFSNLVFAGCAIGTNNYSASGCYSIVIGGDWNAADGNYSSVTGGYNNEATGSYSSVSGGVANTACGCYSFVSGGNFNEANADYSLVSGGVCNKAFGNSSLIIGGCCNTASADSSSIIGGFRNISKGVMSTVIGGYCSKAYADYSTSIGGGITGEASCANTAAYSVAIGRWANTTQDNEVAIGSSGAPVKIDGALTVDGKKIITDGTIIKTWSDVLSIDTSFNDGVVLAGLHNTASGCYSSVSGGWEGVASGGFSSVSGGFCNIASGRFTSVIGGIKNLAGEDYSTIVGGCCGIANGNFSTIVGGCCGITYAYLSTSIGGGITGNATCTYTASGSVAIGKNATTTKNNEVAIGSSSAPVTIGGNLTINSQIHGVVAGTEDTDAVNFGQLKSYSLLYDSENHDNITFSGTNGTKLSNVKSGLINQTSMDAINGAQLYAVKQDISGFARDIKSNESQIRSLSSSINSMNTFNSSFITLIDTVDLSKANTSLNNLDSSGRQVITDIVSDYMSQQNNINTPNVPLFQNNALTITDAGNDSLYVGEGSSVNGTSSIAIGVGNQVNANNSGAFGDPSVINADESYVLGNDDTINTGATGSFIIGNDGVSDAKGGLLFGSNTKATAIAEDGMALGNRTEVSAKNAIALGSGSIADTENTLSIGNTDLKRKIVNVADGDISQNSNEAVTGAQLFVTNEKVQKNTEAIEKKADVDAGNIDTSDWASKLGIGKIEANNTDLVTGGTVYDAIKAINTDYGLIQTNGDAITVGANSPATVIDVANANGQGRVITGVITDIDDATSAANVGYVNQISENIVRSTNAAFQKMDNRINKAGANAAAIASLPTPTFDGDEKWAFSAGVGHYHGETAASAGAFYKPQDNVIVRVGGSFGNGDEMVGAGVSVSLNKGNTPTVSKAQLVRTINAQAGQIQQQANEIQQQANEIQNMKIVHQSQMDDMKAIQRADMQRIAELEAQLVRVTAKLDELAK